jgi:hypothetical protein
MVRAWLTTSAGSDAITTVTITETTSTDKDVLARQYYAPLAKGQAITGAQAVQFVARFTETTTASNMHSVFGIRIINADGTVQKTVLAVTREANEFDAGTPGTLESRNNTQTSAAGNYTTVAGDLLVVEIGAGGDPTSSNPHTYNISLGNNAASFLDASDVDTGADNPWVQLADTLTFRWDLDLPTISNTTINVPTVAHVVDLPSISATTASAPALAYAVTAPTIGPSGKIAEITQSSTNRNDAVLIATNSKFGQTFDGMNKLLRSIKVYGQTSGSVSEGDTYIELFVTDENGATSLPTGSRIAVSETKSTSVFGATETEVEYAFPDVLLESGTEYAWAFTSTVGSVGAHIQINSTSDTGAHSGHQVRYRANFLDWQAIGADMKFVLNVPDAAMFTPTLEQAGGGDQDLTGSTISATTISAPTLAYVVEPPTVSTTTVSAPSTAYAVTNDTISATVLFAATVSPGAVTLENSFIGPTVSVHATTVAYAVENATIAGTAINVPTVAYAITNETISGTALNAPIAAYAVELASISGASLAAPTVAHDTGDQSLTGASISATTVSEPILAYAVTVSTISASALFAPNTAYVVELTAISGTALYPQSVATSDSLALPAIGPNGAAAAPTLAYAVTPAFISGTQLYSATVGLEQTLVLSAISNTAVHAPSTAYAINAASIPAGNQLFGPALAAFNNVTLPLISGTVLVAPRVSTSVQIPHINQPGLRSLTERRNILRVSPARGVSSGTVKRGAIHAD